MRGFSIQMNFDSINHWFHRVVWCCFWCDFKITYDYFFYVKLCGLCDSPTYSLNESFFPSHSLHSFLSLLLLLLNVAKPIAIVVGLTNVVRVFRYKVFFSFDIYLFAYTFLLRIDNVLYIRAVWVFSWCDQSIDRSIDGLYDCCWNYCYWCYIRRMSV